MMDEVHPEDTLFFVAEADFRFYHADCQLEEAYLDMEIAAERLKRAQAQDAVWNPPLQKDLEVSQPPDDSDTQLPDPEALVADPEQWAELMFQQNKVLSSQEDPNGQLPLMAPLLNACDREARLQAAPSPELEDLVSLCNEAARHGRGNFVWLGWNACPDSRWTARDPEKIANGSNLIAVTAAGARWLQPRFEAAYMPCTCVRDPAFCTHVLHATHGTLC